MASTRKFEILYRPVIEPKLVSKLDTLLGKRLFVYSNAYKYEK